MIDLVITITTVVTALAVSFGVSAVFYYGGRWVARKARGK